MTLNEKSPSAEDEVVDRRLLHRLIRGQYVRKILVGPMEEEKSRTIKKEKEPSFTRNSAQCALTVVSSIITAQKRMKGCAQCACGPLWYSALRVHVGPERNLGVFSVVNKF